MADSPWTYDERSKRFRDTRNGRYLPATKAIDLRDGFQERRRADVNALTRRLADQNITVQAWEAEMAALIRNVHAAEYALGRGGLNAMTAEDWRAVDELHAEQRAFLRGFAEEVAAGQLSEAQINARAKLYYGSSIQAYERGRSAAFGVRLPAYPADGSTPCKSACRCRWQLVDTSDTIEATWKRSTGEACSGCKSRAAQWSPLVIAKSGGEERIARLFRVVA